ncbi:hypothetical protein BDP55DRAFT_699483 [Colletotrichum godetiae]|uniref:Uncharacterized protein n=1 Tax=Colletotrichum godetiae TaxID=1209918 RepID=A0AAJ0EMF4_9PEZI|nr:uncharacterized protein BDP55DRAFT_699483 [Colletotrichum godetiae]KAK1656537.1 hypothetical protein BDP55DRAFT_699483 [Colletotrichum godetiae]
MQRVSNPYRQITRRFISLGAVSWVYQIDDEIALNSRGKKSYFESHHSPCPHIIQSFYRMEVANFLQFLPHGSLHDRLQSNQTRDGDRVISVDRFEDRRLSERWAAELCAANAWLEALGLADFDSVASIGQKSLEVHHHGHGFDRNRNGRIRAVWPRDEQFAIGLWFITWCEVRAVRGPEQNIGRLASYDPLERLALNCWRGSFVSIHCLKEAVMDVPGSQDMAEAANWTAEYGLEMRQKL